MLWIFSPAILMVLSVIPAYVEEYGYVLANTNVGLGVFATAFFGGPFILLAWSIVAVRRRNFAPWTKVLAAVGLTVLLSTSNLIVAFIGCSIVPSVF